MNKPNKTIESFAEEYGLRLKRDGCDDLYISSRRGQIFDHGDGRFGLMIFDQTPKIWGSARRSMQAAGFTVIQDGNGEGTALFNPQDGRQVKVAFKVAQPYHKRQVTEAMRERGRKLVELRKMPVAA